MYETANTGAGKVEIVVKDEGQASPSTTPPPLTPAQRRKKEIQEKLREQQALLAGAERQEAAELEAATDASRKEHLLQQAHKTFTDARVAQCTRDLAELILLQVKLTASHFTNWDERIQRLETRVADLGTQQSKILDAIQNLTAQLTAANVISPLVPVVPSLKPKKPSQPPSPPPSPPPGSPHSSRKASPSVSSQAKATPPPTFAAVVAGDHRGPKIPAPSKFKGDDPRIDVGDWAAGTRAYLKGFQCPEQQKVATVVGLLEGPAHKWATSTASAQNQTSEDWASTLGADKLLQALEDRFADKERVCKAADKIPNSAKKLKPNLETAVPSSAAPASAAAAASIETCSFLPSAGTARAASFIYEDPDPDQELDQSECQALAALFFHLKEQKQNKSDLILLRPLIKHTRIKGLLDCGATRNFMSPSAVKKLHLGMKRVQLQQPLQVRIGDSIVLTIREKVRGIPVTFDSAGEVRHSLNFNIFPDLPFDLVFSMQWLRAVDPRIDWKIPKVELPNSKGVYQPCMIAADHHPKTSCFCLRAREFYALSRQYDHERLFIALVKQTDAPTTPCPPEIQQVVDQYADLMQEPFGLPNRPTKHHIEVLPGAVPPKGRIYRMSPAELEELRRQLETLTSKGWMRPSTSEFGAPVLFVPKGSGEFRMCIYYRGLNKITRKNTEPLPRIDDLLDMVQGCTIFSKVNLKSGYHQIEMAEEDTEMHHIFRLYLDKFMVVYLDDILIFSKTTREHAEHLALVLQSLRDSQYKINREKSSFGVPSVIYLGHVISGDGLAPEAAKVVAIQDWPQPQTVRDVRSFLGLASYYRKFVRNFSAVATPLTNLTKKDTPFLWSLHCQMTFAQLKQALTRAPVLKLPDPTLPFVLTTDASQYGIGAVLQQDDGNGLRPVEFMSKKIMTQKLQDSTYEEELYALVSAVKHWKHFLLGKHFKIFSDHSTLQWLKSQGELNDKLTRYIQFIDLFDFELKHKKGCYNKVADALSRRPDSFALISSTHSFGEEVRQTIARSLPQDPAYGPIVRNLQADPNSEPGYALSSDLLYTYSRGEERLCIPENQQVRTLLMSECHDARGHFGFLKSYAALS
ncbi:hypothetical protein CBR_g22203 [Chara braunii]|uniref:Reverse transcriptase domain-containing protein n=1 Tax=Chara braunii TaxID=69332 RepID=A0A388L2B9_CHABU|nr:hypothetical protein CBR_g22203 [Chara braunii]|eukprot:GBG76455.1 hypothetical protein CBR_g22203 [Chara braunii]